MGPGIEVTKDRHGSAVVLAVSGEIDVHTTPQLREALLGEISNDSPTVVLDLAGVTFIDSTGLSVLITALKRARSLGGDVRLRAPSHQVFKVLELTRLHQVFEVEDAP
ncbi:MAG TPA: STAS domain-containing protein [Acidimicrobiales bacterium]|nr:STAS domain-containing protein [Acidimicrobiales bacterium]